MPINKTLKFVAAIAASFAVLVGIIVFLWQDGMIGAELAQLMLVALVGLYLGFGILAAVYRLIGRLH